MIPSESLQPSRKLRARSADEDEDSTVMPLYGKRQRLRLSKDSEDTSDKVDRSYLSHQMSRPPVSRQAYLQQERERIFREQKEHKIDQRSKEDSDWIAKQALLHHMNQQEQRSLREPGGVSQGHSIEQCDGHGRDLDSEMTPVLELVNCEQDEEEQVLNLLEQREPQILEREPVRQETDSGNLDLSDSGQRTLDSLGQSCHGQAMSEPVFYDPAHSTLELNKAASVDENQVHGTQEDRNETEQDSEHSGASQAGPGPSDSRDASKHSEFSIETITGLSSGLPPQIKAWVSSRVNKAREQARNKAKKDEEKYRKLETRAREGLEENMRRQNEKPAADTYHKELQNWPGTSDTLWEAVWRSVDRQIEKQLHGFDDDATEKAKQRQIAYKDEEDRVTREAMEEALAQINEGKQSIARPALEAFQQEKRRAEKAWLEYETSSSAQTSAAKRASQILRRRQTMELKKNAMPSARAPPAIALVSAPSSTTDSYSAAQAPSGSRSLPSQTQESFGPSTSYHTTTAPVEQISASCHTPTAPVELVSELYSTANSTSAAQVKEVVREAVSDSPAYYHTTTTPVEPVCASSGNTDSPHTAQLGAISDLCSPLPSNTQEASLATAPVEPIFASSSTADNPSAAQVQEAVREVFSDSSASFHTTSAPVEVVSASLSVIDSPSAARAPSGLRSLPPSQTQETSEPPTSHHMPMVRAELVSSSSGTTGSPPLAQAPIELISVSSDTADHPFPAKEPSSLRSPLPLEEMDCSLDANPSEGPTQERVRLKRVSYGPDVQEGFGDQQRRSEQEPVYEPQCPLETTTLEDQHEKRRMKELKDALVIARRRARVETTPFAEEAPERQRAAVQAGVDVRVDAPCLGSMLAQPESSPQTSGSSNARPRTKNGGDSVRLQRDDANNRNRNNADGRPIGEAAQPLHGVDSLPDHSQMDCNPLLNQLLERARSSEETINRMAHRARISEETITRMANQISGLNQALLSMIQRGVQRVDLSVGQGAGPSTLAGQGAGPSTPVDPPVVTPSPSQFRARRTGPPGTFRSPVPPPIHKSASAADFHSNCRELIRELLHGGARHDNWPTPPTGDDLKQFETSRTPADGPTKENFRLDFSTRPLHKSVWNQRAAEIFEEVYLSSDYPSQHPNVVKGEFLKRLRRLHEQYCTFLQIEESGNKDKAELMAHKSDRNTASVKRQRRRRRVITLFESRLGAIQSHVTMLRFVPALQQLSSGGMSEDESDHAPDSEDSGDEAQNQDRGSQRAPQGRRYRIIDSQWRSPEVTKWLRTMDLVYTGTKFHEDHTSMPGNQFRQRYPSIGSDEVPSQVRIGRPIIGLPRNFYDAQWLQTLSPQQIEELGIQPEVDINFSVDERRYAAKFIAKKGKNQKDRVASHAEADPNEVAQWVLTGKGFWGATTGRK